MYASIVNCVICDEPVGINIEFWNTIEKPAALCDDCDLIVAWPLLKVIYLLRCEIFRINTQIQSLTEAPA